METIQKIMKSEVTEHTGRYDFSGGNGFNAMELIYFRMKNVDEPGSYSYVPVWRLCNESEYSYDNPILVNAIDGTVIHLLDEL